MIPCCNCGAPITCHEDLDICNSCGHQTYFPSGEVVSQGKKRTAEDHHTFIDNYTNDNEDWY